MANNQVWVRWKDSSDDWLFDTVTDLKDDAQITDLRKAFVRQQYLQGQLSPAEVQVRETTVHGEDRLKASSPLVTYFVPPTGCVPQPGKSEDTALFLTVPRIAARGTKQQEQTNQQYLVLSVSEVAKDPKLRTEFRDKQVAEDSCRGGFIAQKFYLEFVLAAREFETFERKDSVVEEVAKLGQVLAVGSTKKHSLFHNSYPDEEEVSHSAVGSELFRLAIDLLQQDRDAKDPMRLRVTHQQHLVTNIESPDSAPQEFEIIRKRKRETGELESKPVEDEKSLDPIDMCAWFVHPERTLGACVLAACQYKPSGIPETERKAQADMYGSNILILHQKPCIVIDIAGANDLEDWNVSAYGLIQAQFTKKSHLWETSPLYVGRGAEAIVMVARGLLAAQESFPSRLEQYGSRLGPVVGKIDEFVYKVYDMAQHRKPNIDAVQSLFDDNAELLSSKDDKLEIVKMKWIPSNWKKDVNTEVFQEIIRKLRLLHENFGPHGDIRLANLLSCGSIIDFDFVRAERYPSTLNSISQDGKRHPDVEDMIHRIEENGDESSLIQPEKIHDWFSLGQVMRLFHPTDESNASSWESFCKQVEGGLNTVPVMPFFTVMLKDRDMPLAGQRSESE